MEFRFLDNYETSVNGRRTDLIKKNKYGAAAEVTDFAILLGGYVERRVIVYLVIARFVLGIIILIVIFMAMFGLLIPRVMVIGNILLFVKVLVLDRLHLTLSMK